MLPQINKAHKTDKTTWGGFHAIWQLTSSRSYRDMVCVVRADSAVKQVSSLMISTFKRKVNLKDTFTSLRSNLLSHMLPF